MTFEGVFYLIAIALISGTAGFFLGFETGVRFQKIATERWRDYAKRVHQDFRKMQIYAEQFRDLATQALLKAKSKNEL